VSLDVPEAAWAAAVTCLDHEELARAERLSTRRLQRRFIAAHVALRAILGAYLAVSAEDVAFARRACSACGGLHGKPEVAQSENAPEFNLSRSGGLALVAVARRELGVDVEALRTDTSLEDVAELVLSAADRARLRTGQCGAATLYRVWTRKEAVLKAWGDGLNRSAANVPSVEEVVLSDDGRQWSVVDVRAPNGYVAAVAIEGEQPAVLRRLWSWPATSTGRAS
jgi:4'-phosphopantetheinyl transferase